METPVVIILAAGLGTRMKSEKVKVLHEVAGRPLVCWVVDAARAAGARRIVVVVGHQREEVVKVLDDRYGVGEIATAVQVEPRGTGDAVNTALDALESEKDHRIAVILSGDVPLLKPERISALADACRNSESKLSMLATRAPRPMPYGRLVRDAHGTVSRIVEHRDATEDERGIEELNAGFYGVSLGHLRSDLEGLTTDNAQGELYLTDLARTAYDRGGAMVLEVPWDEVTGINDRVDLSAVEAAARREINADWMRAGVSFAAPEQTFIDADVSEIGRDTWMGPCVHLRGSTTIGERCRIDAGCVLENVQVASGVWLKPHSVLTDSVVSDDAQVGPFSHCRPGSRIGEGAKIGNFVETKNTQLMAGAKASHLAYLGDASIGARANIGAGTITCNYDGFSKYKTVIEAGAFIGSDSQLVAPVTVGRDAYVGSGTTVTKDVPRSALALSRTKQINKDGWADRFRAAQQKRKLRKS